MKNCTDCILDGTDACQRGAGRAVDDEVCECFVDDKETEVDFSRMFEESEEKGMTREEILACLTDRPCTVCKFHGENGCGKWNCVFEEEPEDKPVNVVLDEMKSIVDRMIDDGLKMIEKRKERINENT